MGRTARIVVPGIPHHVTQRGNRCEDVFFSDHDRHVYLDLLTKYSAMHGLAIHAYCLMTNHVHLIATPETEHSLSRTLKPVHMRYTQYVNWTHNLRGHLWQGRFYSCALDAAHLWAALRYVERNPVRANIVKYPEGYRWSSAAGHCGKSREKWLTPLSEADLPNVGSDWHKWLSEPDDTDTLMALRKHTSTGRPWGTPDFLDHLENLLHRLVRPRKAGRRPKQPADAI